MISGEDERVVVEDWAARHPRVEPDIIILTGLFGQLPRKEFTTRQSLLEVLPNVKAFLDQCEPPESEAKAWAELAASFGIEWAEVEACRPVSGAVYAQ